MTDLKGLGEVTRLGKIKSFAHSHTTSDGQRGDTNLGMSDSRARAPRPICVQLYRSRVLICKIIEVGLSDH